MASHDTSLQVTEKVLDAVSGSLPPEDLQAFLDLLLQHRVIDYVTWRHYRFAGWTVDDILRETRKTPDQSN